MVLQGQIHVINSLIPFEELKVLNSNDQSPKVLQAQNVL